MERTLLRSLLFVPGNQPDKLEKAWRARPDCVILDLEDGVLQAQKCVARQNVSRFLAAPPFRFSQVLVRINSGSTDLAGDLEAGVHPGVLGILLPKCESKHQVVAVAEAVRTIEKLRGIPEGDVKLLLLIETARGLLDLPSFVGSSGRVAAIVFGAEDWCRDMEVARTKAGDEITIARWQIALSARANRLPAIDTVYPDFRDTTGLLQDTEVARKMGFSGKLAIHPTQIGLIHSAFAPSKVEVAEAEQIVAAFAEAEARGLGAIGIEGRMIDKPIAERARQVLLRARKLD